MTGACAFELLVAVYGGYFGGGMGIMNLAMLAALGMTDIHAMNALKVVLGSVINGVATVTFAVTRDFLAASGGDNHRRGSWRIFRRALRAKIAAGMDSGAGDRGGSWHDGLFFCDSLLKDLRAS